MPWGRRTPFKKAIDRIDREIVDKERQFRRWGWHQQATFLRHYSRTGPGLMLQSVGEQHWNDEQGYRFIWYECGSLISYFDVVPEGSEKITDPNIIRSMALIATVTYTSQVGLPNSDAVWEVYRGVLQKHRLLPLTTN